MWKPFDVLTPPKNWCLARVTGKEGEMFVRWSRSNYAWIGMDLQPVLRYNAVEFVLELDYPTLNDMIYNPRAKKPEPKVYSENS